LLLIEVVIFLHFLSQGRRHFGAVGAPPKRNRNYNQAATTATRRKEKITNMMIDDL
jgi:hypothetical protein